MCMYNAPKEKPRNGLADFWNLKRGLTRYDIGPRTGRAARASRDSLFVRFLAWRPRWPTPFDSPSLPAPTRSITPAHESRACQGLRFRAVWGPRFRAGSLCRNSVDSTFESNGLAASRSFICFGGPKAHDYSGQALSLQRRERQGRGNPNFQIGKSWTSLPMAIADCRSQIAEVGSRDGPEPRLPRRKAARALSGSMGTRTPRDQRQILIWFLSPLRGLRRFSDGYPRLAPLRQVG